MRKDLAIVTRSDQKTCTTSLNKLGGTANALDKHCAPAEEDACRAKSDAGPRCAADSDGSAPEIGHTERAAVVKNTCLAVCCRANANTQLKMLPACLRPLCVLNTARNSKPRAAGRGTIIVGFDLFCPLRLTY